MASTNNNIISLLVIILFLLQSNPTSSDFSLSPLLAPIIDDVCKEVECGKGNCKASMDSTLMFSCECHSGWKQARSDHDHHLDFLPCIIPNCTLDYSCSSAASPSPIEDKDRHANQSFFDPCYWSYCGGGSCNKKSAFEHTCECQQGYDNLLNLTALPCYKECALGMDCAALGLGTSSKSNSSTPSMAGSGTNEAAAWTLPRNLYRLIVPMMMCLAVLHLK